MAGPLETMTRTLIHKTIDGAFPHLKLPALLWARVVEARDLEERFEVHGLTFHNDDSGGSYQGHISAFWREYTLQVLTFGGDVDGNFPNIPGVRSTAQVEPGMVVVIGLQYGRLAPVIYGEAAL